jgi:hypothetical protein
MTHARELLAQGSHDHQPPRPADPPVHQGPTQIELLRERAAEERELAERWYTAPSEAAALVREAEAKEREADRLENSLWRAFGLGGSWQGHAANAEDARRQALASGIVQISWIEPEDKDQ